MEEEARSACGLDPAPPYGRCTLFRDQEASEEWLQDAGVLSRDPTRAPSGAPSLTPVPTGGGSGAPSASPPSASPSGATLEEAGSTSPTAMPASAVLTGTPTAVESETPSGPPTIIPTTVPTSNPIPISATEPPTSGSGWGRFVDIIRPRPATVSPAEPSSTPPSLSPQTNESSLAPVNAGSANSSSPSPELDSNTTSNATSSPGFFDCEAYSVSYERMCNSSSPCCETQRSDTEFCWDLYENIFPDDLIYSACEQCCEGGPKTIGPPATPRDDLPKTIQCSSVENPFRICGSCCEDPRSTSGYCRDIYDEYGDDVEQLCVREKPAPIVWNSRTTTNASRSFIYRPHSITAARNRRM